MSAPRASKPHPAGQRNVDGGPKDPPADRLARPGSYAQESNWLPSGCRPCIWMSAGLLAYKLCDREFECESCPLDAALGGGTLAPARADGARGHGHPALEYRGDRRYSNSHGWVQAVEGTRVRCGVDALAARMLDRISAVVLPAEGSHIRRGEPLCWLVDESEPLPFKAPVSGVIVRTNAHVRSEPALVASKPYDDGWLAEIECSAAGELAGEGLLERTAARARAAHDLLLLRKQLAHHAAPADERVGPTMQDGGRPASPREVLGPAAHHVFVRRILR